MTDQPTTFGPAGWTPDHYRGNGLQPFDVINAFDLDFYEGNALKYLLRWRKKNGLEDLRKARTYVQILIDRAQREADGVPLQPVAQAKPKPMDPLHLLGIGADTEEGRRDARRSAMQLLLARLERGALLAEEKALLRQHVETEIREADTAHSEAEYFQQLSTEQGKIVARAEQAKAETERERDQQAAVLAEVLATFVHEVDGYRIPRRSAEADVVTLDKWRSVLHHDVERPWWQQVDEAQAGIERVRTLVVAAAQTTAAGISDHDIGRYEMAAAVLEALDNTDQTAEA